MAARLTQNDNPSLNEYSQHARGRSEGISKEDFDQLQNFISHQLKKHHVLQLAQSYGFKNSQKSRIETSEEPSVTFVELLAEKGLISVTDPTLADFLQELRDNDFGGIADTIKRYIQEDLQLVPEETNVISSKSEATEYDSHQKNEASAQEEGGNNSTLNETPKRKPDTMENPQQGKKVKQINPNMPDKTDVEKCFIYIHFLIDDYRKICIEDKATMIGAASEITADYVLKTPKSLFMLRRDGGMNLKAETLYSFENLISIEGGDFILIGPHTAPSIVSVKKIKGVNLLKYKDEVERLKPYLNDRKVKSIPSLNIRTVKYHLQPRQPVLSVKGVIKNISVRGYEDNSTPRRVMTLIDRNDNDFLSVVLHEKNFPISDRKFENNNVVELRYFETARTEPCKTNSNFLSSTKKSVIKKIIDGALNHLKDFNLVRGSGIPIEGVVSAVGEAVTYRACPNDRCFLKEVVLKEGVYFCPSCTTSSRKPKQAYYIKLTIDSIDGEEYKGVIFTHKIDELKTQLNLSNSNTEGYLELLPQELLDWKVTANYCSSNDEGLNNVFNNTAFICKVT